MTIKQYGGVFGRNPTFNNVTIEGTLTFDGDIDINSDLTIGGNLDVTGSITATVTGNTDVLTLISTDDDENSGPRLSLTRNSASPADNDYVGLIAFNGQNSAAESIRMGMIRAQVLDVTDGTEDSTLTFYSRHGGTETQRLATTASGISVTGTVTADGLTVDGDARVDGNVTIGRTTGSYIFTELDGGSERAGIHSSADNDLTFKVNNQITAINIDGTTRDISFYEDTGTTPKLFWDASAESLGIGTSSPDTLLELSRLNNTGNTGVPTLRFTDTDASSAAGQKSGQIEFKTSDATPGPVGVHSFINGQTEGTSGLGALVFGTGQSGSASEAMRIDSNGNVGLGTASPSRDLSLNSSGTTTLQITNDTVGTSTTDGFQIKHYTSGATQLWGYEASYMSLATNNTEAMRIDASGNLLVGTTSTTPQEGDHGFVARSSGYTIVSVDDTRPMLINRNTSDGELIQFKQDNGPVGAIGAQGGDLVIYSTAAGHEGLRLGNGAIVATDNAGATTDSECHLGGASSRFTNLYLSTNIHQGATTPSSSEAGVLTEAVGRTTYSRGSGIGGFSHLKFINGNGTVGTVTTSGSATAYNTSSDQRLKENIADADDAGAKIDSIQVRKFDWKADGSHQDYGMVAQELLEVAPEAVSAPEDPEEMMGVDYSKLVPMMLKEIQSLRARIAQLES